MKNYMTYDIIHALLCCVTCTNKYKFVQNDVFGMYTQQLIEKMHMSHADDAK